MSKRALLGTGCSDSENPQACITKTRETVHKHQTLRKTGLPFSVWNTSLWCLSLFFTPAPLPKNKPNIPNKQHLKIERNPLSLTQKAMQVCTKCCHCPFCVKETHICRGGQEKDAKLQVPGEPEREEPGSTQQRHGISPTSGAGVNLTHRGRV